MLGSGKFLPIHWGTFNLAVHPWAQPPESVYIHAPARGIPLVMPKLGQPVEPARFDTDTIDPWWRRVGGATLPVTVEPDASHDAPLEWLPD
jgi:hypothetical protein